MSCIVDCCESEVAILCDMTREGSISSPRPLSLCLSEICVFNPTFSSICGHCTISCSRVMEYPVLILHLLVYPSGCLKLGSIVIEDLVVANLEFLHTVWNVQCLSHFSLVKILSHKWCSTSWVTSQQDFVIVLRPHFLDRKFFESFEK